jgi:metallophosphoesterase (TIGR00282 family)
MKVLFIGDIVGSPGRKAVCEYLSKNKFDFCIANGENAAAGKGITLNILNELTDMGIDIVTMGNHTWGRKETECFINDTKNLLRPLNYPDHIPGNGSVIIEKKGIKLAVINLIGRVFMDFSDCPFRKVDDEIEKIKEITNNIIVDMHAEATSEKIAMGWHLDGKVSAVLGTHTHVQTADEKILPGGTGYITDAGMTGPADGIIGVSREIIKRKFIGNMPFRINVASGKAQFNAVLLNIDGKTGKITEITRILKEYMI